MAMRIRGLRKQRRREKDPHGNEYRMSGPGRRACTQSFFRFIERNWFQKPKRSIHRKKFGQCRKFPRKMWEFRTKFHRKMWERAGRVRKQVGPFGLAALARGRWLARANGSFSSLVSRNCHSFATVSRSLVALADVRGALRLRGRMLVRVRDSRKRMVA